MPSSHDDAREETASTVSTALTEQMLHLSNRFHEECRKLEARTFRSDAEDAGDGEGEA